jgi:hypothetical protein
MSELREENIPSTTLAGWKERCWWDVLEGMKSSSFFFSPESEH